MYMWVWVLACLCVHTCLRGEASILYLHTCEYQRWGAGCLPQSLLCVQTCGCQSWGTGCLPQSLSASLPIQPAWQVSGLQELTCLLSRAWWVQMGTAVSTSCRNAGLELSSWCLHGKSSTDWAISPVPKVLLFSNNSNSNKSYPIVLNSSSFPPLQPPSPTLRTEPRASHRVTSTFRGVSIHF